MDVHRERSSVRRDAAGAKDAKDSSLRDPVVIEIPTTHKPEVFAGHHPPPGAAVPLAPTSRSAAWTTKREPSRIPFNVVQTVEQAQSQLHHSKAILAFLKSVHQEKPSLLQYLHEAERTFLQALENYQDRNFEEAKECAAACCELCGLIEILVSRTFQSAAYMANAAENEPLAPLSFKGIQADLRRVDEMLGRIQWLAVNGTLPSEDREQVQKLVLWSESLHRCAARLIDIRVVEEAIELLHAAEAAAAAAEHICRKSYVNNGNTTPLPTTAD